MASIPTEHPTWCDRDHNPDYPAHTREVGRKDVEVGTVGLSVCRSVGLSVQLYQFSGEPAQVWLAERRHTDTAILQLTPDQARTLGERLHSAADATRSQEYPHRGRLGEGQQRPGRCAVIIRLDDLVVCLVLPRHADLTEQRVEITAARDRYPMISLLPDEARALAWLVRARAREATE